MKIRGDVSGPVEYMENLALIVMVQCPYARSSYSLTAMLLFSLFYVWTNYIVSLLLL